MDFELLGHGLAIQQLKTSEPRRRSTSTKETMETLRNPFLDTQSNFVELKSYLEQYYKEKSEGAQLTKWKEVLYTSLHGLLNEVIFTNDRNLQLKLLTKIVKWFHSKVNPNKPTSLYSNKTVSIEPKRKTKIYDMSMRSTAADTFSKSKRSTPQPKGTLNMLKTTYQAFVKPYKLPDAELDSKLNSIFESMKERQEQRLKIGHYKEKKIQEWSEHKVRRLENLNHRREAGSISFSTNPEIPGKLNSSLYDFSSRPKAEKSFDSDESDEKYSLFSRPGILRKLNQGVIDIEEMPRKRKELNIEDEFKLTSEGSVEKINELFRIKSRLARRGIKSDLRDLELGVIDAQLKFASQEKVFPLGGETLISNPFIKVKTKTSKKKSKKKKSKKN